MSWLSKQLKRNIKVLDPVGAKLRKETGGNYLDPLNQYTSHPPGTAKSSYVPKTRELTPAPNGQTTLGTVNIGGANTGGRTYAPNPFQAQMAQAQAIRQQPMGGQLGQPMGQQIGASPQPMPQMQPRPMTQPAPQGQKMPMPYRGGNPKAMMFG
jgi:hypothetical protein